MINRNNVKIGAVVIVIALLGSVFLFPLSSAINTSFISTNVKMEKIILNKENSIELDDFISEFPDKIPYDTSYTPEEEILYVGEQNDIGYNIDVRNTIVGSLYIYPGEPVDQTVPGRGRTGTLEPDNGDPDDWFRFSLSEGQSVQASISSSQDFSSEICDTSGKPVGSSFTAVSTGFHFLHIFANDGTGTGDYTISITVTNQNDAGTGVDAGNSIGAATAITPGSYSGYMTYLDVEDWYSFNANSGQGIFISLEVLEKSDYDVHLYNPSGVLVHSAQFYGDDELEYPADASGTWKIKLDMFPGWDAEKWPDNYFLYGSGAYNLDLEVGGIAEEPSGPIPQPDINPVAQTFVINNDPDSNKDEYGYIAAVPAANYIDGGERFVSPIVYQGVDDITNWDGTVDDTTQYLIDDWNTYLSRHGIEANEYIVDSDPVKAAADIAVNNWDSSSKAVLVVDGSGFEDEITTVIDKDETLVCTPESTVVTPSELKTIGVLQANPMFIGKSYGAIHLIGKGDNFAGDTGIITPRYEGVMEDWFPFPYDTNGEDKDTFYPIAIPGIWMPYVTSNTGLEELEIVLYKGDRYTIPVGSEDASIEVTISTDEPSNLVVFLIDPNGNVRRPMTPHWNGGEVNPIHYWNGGHWQEDYDEFRAWIVEPHDDYSVEVHNVMEGKWTAIVVPFIDCETGLAGFNGGYHITANVRTYSQDRISAGLSAANGAVIASMNHAPLLFVTEDSVPSETTNALTGLGVTNIIFVNIDGVSSASPGGTVTEYTSMQQVVDAIKANSKSENFITITSFGTGDGYFASSAMIAAYHTSPVLNIGEAKEAFNALDMMAAWREYAGDYYHGCRSVGHLPHMDHPFSTKEFIQGLFAGEFPAPGFDLKLRWNSDAHDGIYDLISGYGLDLEGKEAYMFVSPRDTDIRGGVCRAMTGNNSFAGQIPVETQGFATALICRDILYPAVIYANPGRDVTSSCLFNFMEGGQWLCNDGNRYTAFTSSQLKELFMSHGRTYEGHSLWENLLERYNEGASVVYHSTHGTGGSGICCMYENIEEQFPLAHIRYEQLRDFNWWDGWRGYLYDDTQTKTPRWGGATWSNSAEPNLYDIVHFKYVDELFDNLHSEFNMWMSCTTGEHFGPMIYLEHGCALWYGNSGSGLSPQEEIYDLAWFEDVMERGIGIGKASSDYVWLHQRDYTTNDPTTLYSGSSLQVTNVQVIFGDPTMVPYSPEWIEPTPIVV